MYILDFVCIRNQSSFDNGLSNNHIKRTSISHEKHLSANCKEGYFHIDGNFTIQTALVTHAIFNIQ